MMVIRTSKYGLLLILWMVQIFVFFGVLASCKTVRILPVDSPSSTQPTTGSASDPASNSKLSPATSSNYQQILALKSDQSVFSVVTNSVTSVVDAASDIAVDVVGHASIFAESAANIATGIAGAAVDVTRLALDEAARLIGIARIPKTGWKGTITRIPFRHYKFAERMNREVSNFYSPPEAMLISNKIEMRKFLMLFGGSLDDDNPLLMASGNDQNSSAREASDLDFDKEVFLSVLINELSQAEKIQISRVDEGEDFMIQVTVLYPAFGCGTLYAKENLNPMHMIRLLKSDLLDGEQSLRKGVRVIYRRKIEFCPRAVYVPLSKQTKQKIQRIEFSPYFFFRPPMEQVVDVVVQPIVLEDRWGQWEIFYERYCAGSPECHGLKVPENIPQDEALIGVMDQQDFSIDRQGDRQLEVRGVYTFGGQILVDLHRTVRLCLSRSHSLLNIIRIKTEWVDIPFSLTREHIRFRGPLVPEDQVACR